MDICAFGDSFIFGSDLKDCNDIIARDAGSPYTWTRLLAKKLNLRHWGYSQPGISNLAIADDVIRIVSQKGNQVFYSIHWTWIDRIDFMPGIYDENNVGARYIVEMPHKVGVWRSLTPTSKDEFAVQYYKHIQSDFVDKLKNLSIIYTTIQILQNYNCCFHMTSNDYLLFDTTNHVGKASLLLQEKVQPFLHDYDGKNFIDWAKYNKFPISDNWHPLEAAHDKAAEYWLPTYKRLINTHAKEDYLHAFE
jgi:hypothetical protein